MGLCVGDGGGLEGGLVIEGSSEEASGRPGGGEAPQVHRCAVRDEGRARGEERPMMRRSARSRVIAKAGVVTRAATSVGPKKHGSATSTLLADSSSAVARPGGGGGECGGCGGGGSEAGSDDGGVTRGEGVVAGGS